MPVTDVKESYTEFHKKRKSEHLYPTEWVIRSMLGTYPELKLNNKKYKGSKILDLGFGDCRNMPLLHNCGFDIYGVEITEDVVSLGETTLQDLNIKANLKVGSNTNIPFPDEYFNYILASSSCYYVDANTSFEENLKEINRVLKPGGFFIANFPLFSQFKEIPESFILDKCEFTDDGHIIIRNDIYGIRNGYKFKAFQNKADLQKNLSSFFDELSVGYTLDNYYGIQINTLISTSRKKLKL